MDLGMSELLVIGIVALIVIGPKDLPEMFRQLGRFTAKMRAMARDFSRAMEQAAKETGVADVAKDLNAVTNPKSMGMNAVKDAVDKFERWDPIKNAAKPTEPMRSGPLVPPPMPPMAKPAEVAAEVSAVTEPTPLTAEAVTPTPAPGPTAGPATGPNTAALYEKKAAKEAIVKEAAAKLKALDAAPVATIAAEKPAVAKSARASKPAAATGVTEAAPKTTAPKTTAPKAPRKKKAAEE
jgi:sec-independent protein translocase protein TatB